LLKNGYRLHHKNANNAAFPSYLGKCPVAIRKSTVKNILNKMCQKGIKQHNI